MYNGTVADKTKTQKCHLIFPLSLALPKSNLFLWNNRHFIGRPLDWLECCCWRERERGRECSWGGEGWTASEFGVDLSTASRVLCSGEVCKPKSKHRVGLGTRLQKHGSDVHRLSFLSTRYTELSSSTTVAFVVSYVYLRAEAPPARQSNLSKTSVSTILSW